MLEGQAAFRRSCWRKKECHSHSSNNNFPTGKGSQPCPCFPPFLTLGADHSPSVWSTTAAGFPAPIITTRSIQIGVSKWPLGSAELQEQKWMPVREKDVGTEGGDPGQGHEAVSCEHPQGPASS